MYRQAAAVQIDPRHTNVIRYDVIGMLIFILSAIFHDPIHDFGLTIERMAKIVLYIDDMIAQLNIAPVVNRGGGGGSNFDDMVGGFRSRSQKNGSHRGKKTPSRGSRHRQGTPRQGTPRQGSRNRRNNKHTGVNKPYAAVLPTIAEEKKSKPKKIPLPSYYTDIIVSSLPMTNPNPYIRRYSFISAAASSLHPGNNIGLEFFVQVNRLIDSLKLSVVQTVMTLGIGEGREITQQVILNSISNVIAEVERSVQDENSEFTDVQFQATKNKCVFILESMHILLTHMNFPQAALAAMDMDTSPFNTYKGEQQPFRWLNLFNGSLFDDIMRVIAVGHLTGLDTPPDIAELYLLFKGRVQMQYGGNASKPDNRIMSGGAKMVLSSFREYEAGKKDELVGMINGWNDLQQQPPPNEAAYLNFYDMMLEPTVVNRTTDSRLVRKLHPERFGEMKQMIKRLRLRDSLRGDPLHRSSRFTVQLLADPTIYKNVVDDFMTKVKSDFDSLIAEDELATANAEAADAARPLARVQRQAVYNISHLIAKKGLVYSQSEFQSLSGLLAGNQLEEQTLVLLPNLGQFLPIASGYVNGILQSPPVLQPPGNLVDHIVFTEYMEKDKYTTLLFQLYLLGLIHHHGISGNTGGLPDIDSRLAANIVQKLGSAEHVSWYREMGYEYLDSDESVILFQHIARYHSEYNVIDNGIPSDLKEYFARSTLCNIPARVDPAAGFGGCTDKNQQFGSMTMFVTDLEGRNTYFTKHIFYQDKNTVTIVYEIRLSDGTVISNTVPDIDLSKAPNELSANRVMKEVIQKIIDMWKNNPQVQNVALAWGILEQNDNFKELMKTYTKKGKGDIDQETSTLAPNAGFDDNPGERWLRRKMVFGVGDRPSSNRAINKMKFALGPTLFRQGKGIMSYTNRTHSFTLAHRDCITPQQRERRGITITPPTIQRASFEAIVQPPPAAPAAPSARRQPSARGHSQVQKPRRGAAETRNSLLKEYNKEKVDENDDGYSSRSRSRSRSRGGGGSRKTHRRLYKVKSRYTRKKSRARK